MRLAKKQISFTILKTKLVLAGLALLFLTLNIKAQNSDTTITKQLNDAVVTGQLGETNLQKSIIKVKVIDSKRIELQGAVNLKDVLSNELNIRVVNDPNLGSGLVLQGVGGQGVKILIDGVPVIGREGGNIDLNQINLNNIERIEIIEGPMSINYGSDALGGVINLITKKNTTKQFGLNLDSYAETTGQINFGIGSQANFKNTGIEINFGRNFFDGYHPNEKETRFRTWKPREQYFADFNLSYRAKWGNLRWQNNYFNELVTNRDSGTITPFYAYGLDEYYLTKRVTSSLFYDKKITKILGVNIVVAASHYTRYKNTYRKDLVSLEENLTPAAEQHDTNNFVLWMSRGTFNKIKPGSKLNYQFGYETNYEKVTGGKIEGGSQQIADISIFVGAEYQPLNKLYLRPGFRATYNSRFNAPFIPALHLKWDIADNILFRASYATGFRAPTLKELYLNFVDPSHNVHGNTNLTAETSENAQVAFAYNITKQKHFFKVEPSLFYNYIHNQIELVMVNSSTLEATYANVNWFTSHGTNLTAEYKTPVYAFQAGYAYTGKKNAYSPDNSFFYNHEFRINATYNFKKWPSSLSVFCKYNGQTQAYQYSNLSNQITLGSINAFTLLDVSYNKAFLNNKLAITFGFKNLLDVGNVQANLNTGVHQSNSLTTPIGMGRSAFIALKYTLAKNIH